MSRYFTLLEAEALLPELQHLLRALLDRRREYRSADGELDAIEQRIALTGGMVAPREHIAQLRTRKDNAARGLKSSIESVHELGCLLKDVDSGLVDFPTLYRDEEVYLCWKTGEPGIGFWHPVEDGFRGRRRIDGEFLANHRGQPRDGS